MAWRCRGASYSPRASGPGRTLSPENRALAHVNQSMNTELIGGRYELLDRLGAGGMGEVYRARDRLTEEIVSLKRALQMPVALAGTPLALGDPGNPPPQDGTTTALAGEPSHDHLEKAETV